MTILTRLKTWFDEQFGFSEHIKPLMEHPVPPGVAKGKTSYMYLFGNATLVAFLVQVVTGAILATKYIPSAAHAYDSLVYITNEVRFGALLRAMHLYGASAMVILIMLHTARVFLTGSYKHPRQMNWLSGVLLLLLTMGMAWTGQLLRWDENGVWSVVVASQIAGRTPLIGPWLAQFILAGETLGGATLSRFFIFHVLMFPLLIFAFVAAHFYLLIYHGTSEPPRAGHPVDPKTYRSWYKDMLHKHGVAYFPFVVWKEVLVGVSMIAIVVILAIVLGPRGPNQPPDPTQLIANPAPDWYFLWLYALVAYKPPAIEDLVLVYMPLIILGAMLILPFIASKGERSPFRRPWAIGIVVIAGILLVVLTGAGTRANFVPEFNTEPLTAQELGVADDDLVSVGAQIYYETGCQYCHAVGGRGGNYGPDLTDVTRRLPPQEIIVRTMGGIGDMPPYQNILTLEQLNAIVVFLESFEGPQGVELPEGPVRQDVEQ